MKNDRNDRQSPELEGFVSAGYFVVRSNGKIKTAFGQLPDVISASTYIKETLPDSWAFKWVIFDKDLRFQAARSWGLAEKEANEFVTWATREIQKGNVGWPNVLASPEVAIRMVEKFTTTESRRAHLIGLGLHRALAASLVADNEPASEQRGLVGVLKQLRQGQRLAPRGRVLGFDVLSLDVSGDFDSWLRYSFDDLQTSLKVSRPRHGLFSDHLIAEEYAVHARNQRYGMEPWHWSPFVVLEYSRNESRRGRTH